MLQYFDVLGSYFDTPLGRFWISSYIILGVMLVLSYFFPSDRF